jgi:hypothetical protein
MVNNRYRMKTQNEMMFLIKRLLVFNLGFKLIKF